MSNSVVEAVQQSMADKRSAAFATYREQLALGDDADVKALRRVVSELAISADRLAADAATIKKAKELEAKAADADDAELADQIRAASAAWRATCEETKRIIAEREAMDRRDWNAFQALSNRQTRGHDAKRALRELRQRHAELFGLSEPEEEKPSGPVMQMPNALPSSCSECPRGKSGDACPPLCPHLKGLKPRPALSMPGWPKPGGTVSLAGPMIPNIRHEG